MTHTKVDAPVLTAELRAQILDRLEQIQEELRSIQPELKWIEDKFDAVSESLRAGDGEGLTVAGLLCTLAEQIGVAAPKLDPRLAKIELHVQDVSGRHVPVGAADDVLQGDGSVPPSVLLSTKAGADDGQMVCVPPGGDRIAEVLYDIDDRSYVAGSLFGQRLAEAGGWA